SSPRHGMTVFCRLQPLTTDCQDNPGPCQRRLIRSFPLSRPGRPAMIRAGDAADVSPSRLRVEWMVSMSDFQDQIPFAGAEFADNPEPRCPCLLLLDPSGSMSGQPIAQLNEGIAAFKSELTADTMAAKRVEVGIVSFGPVKVA